MSAIHGLPVPSINSITRVRALWSGSSSKSHDPEIRTHDYHLQRRPLRGGMLGHIEVNDTTTVVVKHHFDEWNVEGCGWHKER